MLASGGSIQPTRSRTFVACLIDEDINRGKISGPQCALLMNRVHPHLFKAFSSPWGKRSKGASVESRVRSNGYRIGRFSGGEPFTRQKVAHYVDTRKPYPWDCGHPRRPGATPHR
jgi:hypothetical protein